MSQILKPNKGYKLVKGLFGKYEEIPEEWNLRKFGKICKLEYGVGLTKEERSNNGFPVYGSGGIIGYHSKFDVKGPGLILARKGSLGNVFYEQKNFWAIDTAYYISNDETKEDLKFLFYLLNYLKLEKYKITTAQPGINRDDVYSINVKYPSFNEQQKIASVLSNMDNFITNKQKVINKTKKVKKGLMQKLLTRGINHKKFKKVKWLFGKEIEFLRNGKY